MLSYLGTRPRTSYLGRVRNPNAAMPGAQYIGHTSEFEEAARRIPVPIRVRAPRRPTARTETMSMPPCLTREELVG